MRQAVQHTNRKGDTYTLYQGKTKTGKPKYFFAKTDRGTGQPVREIPDGFEIYEDPHARVLLRKSRPRLVTEFEEAYATQSIRKLANVRNFQVDVREGAIVIYTAENGRDCAENSPFAQILGVERMQETFAQYAYYTAVLRFDLHDGESRQYTASRFCFRGSIDDWVFLDGPDSLPALVEKYVPHLGKDSFYDLF